MLYGMFGDRCGSSIEGGINNQFPSIEFLRDRGVYTDDSEMTLAVDECIKKKTFSAKDFLLSFKRNCKNYKSYSKKTLEIISMAETNFTTKNSFDTNGAIMRALPFVNLEKNFRQIPMENNLLHTHYNYSAMKTCIDYVSYLDILLNSGKVLFTNPEGSDIKFRFFFCNSSLGKLSTDEVVQHFTRNGFTIKNSDTFAYAYWFFINHDEKTFEKGLEEILKRGGDTDTVAKLYCEMVGCVSSCFDKYL